MKKLIWILVSTLCSIGWAAGPDLEPFVRKALPDCPGEVKISQEEIKQTLPPGFTAKAFNIEGQSPGCSGRHTAVFTPSGNFYIGSPWPVAHHTGDPADKIRAFALEHMKESFKVSVGSQKNEDGLLPVEMLYNTEAGKVPMRGWVDPAGTIFFPGLFYPSRADFGKFRLEKLSTFLSKAPTSGPADAPVTVVEFSDFQCPSCKSAATYIKPLLQKYATQVRYTRVDYPLVSHHPWAFGAAVIGRAIYQQSPEAFWKFKDAVYENQANLNMFTLEDFARGFLSDHDLNVESFNTAIAAEETKKQILDSIGIAYALQVYGTPTFLVNGQFVIPGVEGKHLDAAIARALKKS